MPRIDQTNIMVVTEVSSKGVFVDGKEYGALFLREAPRNLRKGSEVKAFIYQDAANKVVATSKTPCVEVGQCAYLKVLTTSQHGAFLDWGVPKNLLLPYSEQAYPVKEGSSYVVYVHINPDSGRVVASTKLHHYLEENHDYLQIGDAVDLLIAAKSDLGFKAVINDRQLGLIYHSDLSHPLSFGSKIKGWVKGIRYDGKVDLSIHTLDKQTRDQLEMRILKALQQSNGRMGLSDKSSPEVIFRMFNVSKKNFKRALGRLYKQRLINIEAEFIELVD
ncbi:hypothetical protein AB835_05075 [Candidatus Endobugula sertula]|uniref:GntR family transcriptional regulator n=1 Tax=Candidatus Endobugula sertula TaxID=62101 RepID=A0A1D2QR96_9GAMM|nr:hypothetical protein AB835_05075 [Candidatus Endobugula sertula]